MPQIPCAAPPPAGDLLADLLSQGTPIMRRVFARAQDHRLQILLTPTNPGPTLAPRSHGFRVDAEYFYPASTIKLCAMVAALQTIANLRATTDLPITPDSPLIFHPLFPGDRTERIDTTNNTGRTFTVAHEIRKIALVSDNPAHNRLYSLIGHREINEAMWAAGLSSVRIHHRLSRPQPPSLAATTGHLDILCDTRAGPARLCIPRRESSLSLPSTPSPKRRIGVAHVGPNGLVKRPMDFSRKNSISLTDLHTLLTSVIAPAGFAIHPTLALSPADRALLLQPMNALPRTSANPRYSPRRFPDHFAKPLLPGLRRLSNSSRFSITNKFGQAYGFTTDNAFVFDSRSRRGFILTATLYTNHRAIIGTDTYDYRTIARPFFADLGESLARHFFS